RPVLKRFLARAAGEGDLAGDALRDCALEAIVDALGELRRALAGDPSFVEALQHAQGFGAATLDLDHQITLGSDTVGQLGGVAVALQRGVRPSSIELELAEELERESFFAPDARRTAAFERAQQTRLRLHEMPLEARDVSEADRDLREPPLVVGLEEHALGAAIALLGRLPVTALLVNDAKAEKRGTGVREPAERSVGFESAGQMRNRRAPLTAILVNEAEI